MTLEEIRGFIQTAEEFAQVEDAAADRGFDYLPGWFDAAKAIVEKYAPGAPDALHDRSVQMVIGYWMASPSNPSVTRSHMVGFTDIWTDAKMAGNALRYSGAMALLTAYRARRAL